MCIELSVLLYYNMFINYDSARAFNAVNINLLLINEPSTT